MRIRCQQSMTTFIMSTWSWSVSRALLSISPARAFSSLKHQPCRASSFLLATTVPRGGASRSSSDAAAGVVLDPLVVCGPSGVGKSTIIQGWMNHKDYQGAVLFGFSVSHTTRQPREGEVDGVDYHFVSVEQIERLQEEDGFLETAHVHGNYYGTSWKSLQDVQDAGKRCLLDLDVQGVQTIKNVVSKQSKTTGSRQFEPRFIFIAPPSFETLENRLSGRGTESKQSLERRLNNARAEVDYGLGEGNFHEIVTNHDVKQAVQDFDAAVRRLYKP